MEITTESDRTNNKKRLFNNIVKELKELNVDVIKNILDDKEILKNQSRRKLKNT